MSIEQLALALIAGLAAVWGVAKGIIPRLVDAGIKAAEADREDDRLADEAEREADAYKRARAAFREDAAFELLGETLDHLKSEHDQERQEAREERAQAREEAREDRKLLGDLIQSINRVAANVDRNTEVTRLVVQQMTAHDDRLSAIETVLKVKGTKNLAGAND